MEWLDGSLIELYSVKVSFGCQVNLEKQSKGKEKWLLNKGSQTVEDEGIELLGMEVDMVFK